MFYDLFTNITILVAFLCIAGQVIRHYSIEDDPSIKGKITTGVIFAILGFVLMIFTINVTDIVIIDLRNLAIICANIFGGPVSIIITSIGIGLFRILYFGLNIASVTACITAILVGVGCVYISKTSLSHIKKFVSMLVMSIVVSNLALIYLLYGSSNVMEITKYYWIFYIFGGAITYYACRYIIVNNKIYKEMSYYQIMADNLLDMITLQDLNGIYKYASPSSKQLIGSTPEIIIGKTFYDFIHPDDLEILSYIQKSMLNNELKEFTQELRFKKHNGDYVWVESTFKAIEDTNGANKEVICATRDISERKKIEMKLREQKEEAIEANRLKSQFLANMSHELRTPLNSIIGFTTRVLKKSKGQLSETQEENLTIVKKEAQHLLALINDLLDYSKLEAGKMEVAMETFELENIVDETFSMTKNLIAEKNITMEKVIRVDSTIMNSDRMKLKQILINIVSNAIKYSEKGTVRLTVDKEDHYFIISVEDQGVGIDKEYIDNIFDEFYQVDGSYTRKVGGAGLGLAITKKFVDMLGGDMQVKSTIGEGSCFTFSIPVNYDKEVLNSHAMLNLDTDHEQSNNHNVIAFIDDDFSTRKLYTEYLIDEGFTSISIDDSKNVEEIIADIIKLHPTAIILDIILPKSNGWDILFALKQNSITKNIPVIMSSVLNEQQKGYPFHPDEYLVKPIIQDDLISAIHRTIKNTHNIEILIADDDENYLKLVSQYLNEAGISYRTAKDGKDAIEKIKTHNPELVILDIMMPIYTGMEVLDWLQNSKKYQHINVIVVSAKDLTNKERSYLTNSANLVIHKSGMQIEEIMKKVLKDKGRDGHV